MKKAGGRGPNPAISTLSCNTNKILRSSVRTWPSNLKLLSRLFKDKPEKRGLGLPRGQRMQVWTRLGKEKP